MMRKDVNPVAPADADTSRGEDRHDLDAAAEAARRQARQDPLQHGGRDRQ